MTLGTPSAVCEAAPAYSALLNRRFSVRYPCGAATATRVARKPGQYFRRVRVHDISQGGIALVLRKPLRPGKLLFIQVKNRILGFSFDLAAEVRHATKHTPGHWLVGCAFTRELSPAELASLL